MTGHALVVITGLVGAGTLAVLVALLAVGATAAALVGGRRPQAVAAARSRPIDRVEAVLFARYVRGEIDADEYRDQLARAAEAIR